MSGLVYCCRQPVCVIFRSGLKHVRNIRIFAAAVPTSLNDPSTILDHELVFEMQLQNDITRTYRFRYADCEIISAVFDEEEPGCSFLRARPKVFAQLLNHIHHSPEVCISASADGFAVNSYHQQLGMDGAGVFSGGVGGAGGNGTSSQFVNTGLSVSIAEFDNYEFRAANVAEEMVFCVKEVSTLFLMLIPSYSLSSGQR